MSVQKRFCVPVAFVLLNFFKHKLAYNPVAATNVMCLNTISIGWDGYLYDCDFNQSALFYFIFHFCLMPLMHLLFYHIQLVVD